MSMMKSVPLSFAFLLFAIATLRGQSSSWESIHEFENRRAASVPMAQSENDSATGVASANSVERSGRALTKRVFGWVPYWISPSQWASFDWSALTAIGYFSLEADTLGRAPARNGWPVPALAAMARANGVKFMLTVTLFGGAQNAALLSSPARRTRLVNTIVDAIDSGIADGVNLDFESVPGSQRANLVAFVAELAPRVRAAVAEAEISMAVPAVDWSNAFDVNALGTLCDYLIIMGYDYHWRGAPTAGPVAPLAGEAYNITRSVQTYLSKDIPADKLLLGVPWYGYDWGTVDSTRGAATNSTGTPVLYEAARYAAEEHGRMFDGATSTPWYRYKINDQWHQAWYDDSLSLALKYRHVNEMGLGGIGIWALGYQGGSIDAWQTIHAAFDASSSVTTGDGPTHDVRMFVDGTQLRIDLSRDAHVVVSLFDVLGRKLAAIVDEHLAAGTHVRALSTLTPAAGLYVMQIDGTAVMVRASFP